MMKTFKDKRWIYIMIFGIIFFSSLAPITFPVPVVQWSKDFYKTVNEGVTVSFASPPKVFAGVKENTRVMIINSGETAVLWGDMSEAVTSVWKDLIARKANILLWSGDAANDATLQKYLIPLLYGADPSKHPDYGKKFVNLGYVAGGNQLLEQWKDSIKSITPVDAYGNSLDSLPMIQNFNALKSDCELMVGLDARGLETIFVVRYNTPVIEIGGTDSASYLALSYTGGYFKGMIMGQRGGAEYEVLSGIKGKAFSYLQNTLTIASVMIIIMVVANVRYVLDKQPKGAKEVK